MGLCRKLFLCLSLCIVLPLFGGFTYSYSLSTKEGTVTGYDGTDEHVVIPHSFTVSEKYKDEDDGETHTRYHTISVTGIGSSAFRGNTTIKSFSFPNKLKSIGSYSFHGCTSITGVLDLSSVSNIGGDAFRGCTGITGVKFSDNLKSIGASAFSGCTSLDSVKTPTTLTSLGASAFSSCTALEEAEINGTNLDLSSSEFIFHKCKNLRKVVFGDGVIALCTEVEVDFGYSLSGSGTFDECTNLQHVVVGRGVSAIPRALFYKCGSEQDGLSVSFLGEITSIDYRAFQNSTLKEIDIQLSPGGCTVDGYVFSGCSDVSFAMLDFSKITKVGNEAFKNCKGIVGVVDISNVSSIGESAFSGCSGITGVKFSDSLKSIGSSAFSGCTSLDSVKTPTTLTSLGASAFSSCTALEEVEINGTNLNLGSSKNVFVGCVNLRKIKFGDGVTALPVGSSSYNGPFVRCTALEEVVVGAGVTEIPIDFLNANKGDQDPEPSKVTFAGNITRVRNRALSVSSLTDLVINLADGCIVDSDAFSGCPGVTCESVDFWLFVHKCGSVLVA